ncbi:hypothetical protein GVAV_000354 [Gurleya vavrai]
MIDIFIKEQLDLHITQKEILKQNKNNHFFVIQLDNNKKLQKKHSKFVKQLFSAFQENISFNKTYIFSQKITDNKDIKNFEFYSFLKKSLNLFSKYVTRKLKDKKTIKELIFNSKNKIIKFFKKKLFSKRNVYLICNKLVDEDDFGLIYKILKQKLENFEIKNTILLIFCVEILDLQKCDQFISLIEKISCKTSDQNNKTPKITNLFDTFHKKNLNAVLSNLGHVDFICNNQDVSIPPLPCFFFKRNVYEFFAESIYVKININTIRNYKPEIDKFLQKKFKNKNAYNYCKISFDTLHSKYCLELFWQSTSLKIQNKEVKKLIYKVLLVYGGLKYLKSSKVFAFFANMKNDILFWSNQNKNEGYEKYHCLINQLLGSFKTKFLESSLFYPKTEFFNHNNYQIQFNNFYDIKINFLAKIKNSCQKKLSYDQLHHLVITFINNEKKSHLCLEKFVYEVNYQGITNPFISLLKNCMQNLKKIDSSYEIKENERLLYKITSSYDEKGDFWYLMFSKEEIYLVDFLNYYSKNIENIHLLINKIEFELIIEIIFPYFDYYLQFYHKVFTIFFQKLEPNQLFQFIFQTKRKLKEYELLIFFFFIKIATTNQLIISQLKLQNCKELIDMIDKDLIRRDYEFFNFSVFELKKIVGINPEIRQNFKYLNECFEIAFEFIKIDFMKAMKISDFETNNYISIKSQ